jgi:prepilin-type N-terminal cleavage/methylation domain-containing protein
MGGSRGVCNPLNSAAPAAKDQETMIRTNTKSGFTLIELMIVVAIIAIIAAVAIPRLMTARISANENAAIATLRSIAAAQQQVQASSAVDTDADGGGEYCFFGELAGTANLRECDPVAIVPVLSANRLTPAYLATAFGNVLPDSTGDGVVERQGYYYKIFLPDDNVDPAAATGAYPEDPAGGANAGDMGAWGSSNCEIMWCCYAWPVTQGRTGNRAFFINHEGDVISHDNKTGVYSGLAASPTFDVALNSLIPLDFGQPLGLAALGNTSNDGNLWVTVGN